jgi:hypothetical protein
VSGIGIPVFINGQKIAKDEDRIPTQSPTILIWMSTEDISQYGVTGSDALIVG